MWFTQLNHEGGRMSTFVAGRGLSEGAQGQFFNEIDLAQDGVISFSEFWNFFRGICHAPEASAPDLEEEEAVAAAQAGLQREEEERVQLLLNSHTSPTNLVGEIVECSIMATKVEQLRGILLELGMYDDTRHTDFVLQKVLDLPCEPEQGKFPKQLLNQD